MFVSSPEHNVPFRPREGSEPCKYEPNEYWRERKTVPVGTLLRDPEHWTICMLAQGVLYHIDRLKDHITNTTPTKDLNWQVQHSLANVVESHRIFIEKLNQLKANHDENVDEILHYSRGDITRRNDTLCGGHTEKDLEAFLERMSDEIAYLKEQKSKFIAQFGEDFTEDLKFLSNESPSSQSAETHSSPVSFPYGKAAAAIAVISAVSAIAYNYFQS